MIRLPFFDDAKSSPPKTVHVPDDDIPVVPSDGLPKWLFRQSMLSDDDL